MTGADTAAPGFSMIGPLDPHSAAYLTVARGYPCISVLMPTSPGPRMSDADAGRLAGFVHEVKRQLEDQDVLNGARLVAELEHLARVARHSRTDLGLGLFVNRSLARGWTLPTTVHAKAVVESTFATRDVLRALHRTPPHHVLHLDAFGARMFWVSGGPTIIGSVERVTQRSVRSAAQPGGPETSSEERADFVSRVDAALGRVRQERPAPLVLSGDPALLSELKTRSRWLDRLAGEVGPEASEPDQLFRAAAAQLEEYLYRRGQQTLAALREAAARAPDRLVCGLGECWAAVTSNTEGTLLVEHGYVHPHQPDEPDGLPSHDLVDDLLELALERGNLIAFVDDGQLHEFGGVALLRAG